MDEIDTEQLAKVTRILLIVAIVAALACLLVLAIDYRLKRDIVLEADQWRREVRANGNQPQQPPRGGYSGHVPDSPGRPASPNGMAGPAPRPQDQGEARAAPIVAPGTESARPPHRGAVDG